MPICGCLRLSHQPQWSHACARVVQNMALSRSNHLPTLPNSFGLLLVRARHARYANVLAPLPTPPYSPTLSPPQIYETVQQLALKSVSITVGPRGLELAERRSLIMTYACYMDADVNDKGDLIVRCKLPRQDTGK